MGLRQSLSDSLYYLVRGPVKRYKPTPEDTQRFWQRKPIPLALPPNTSSTFETHVRRGSSVNFAEAAGKQRVQSLSAAWDETEGIGIVPYMRRADDNLTEQQRKELCLEVYRVSPWVSACVDAIAKRITSGGFAIEPITQGEGIQAHYDTLHDFCLRINDHWDFLQLLRSIITDILIFGEAYVEIVRQGKVPYQLHKIDCITMSYEIDEHGVIIGYTQTMMHRNKAIPLDPENIIRWWLPHPRANMIALSPIERILDAINLDKHMVNFQTKFFEKGAKAPFWIKTGSDSPEEGERFREWFVENHTGDRNAYGPIVTWGNAEVKEFGKGSVDMDFQVGRERTREEILAGYHVPPMVVGVIKTAGLGGTGEDQEKSFQYNTCDPLKQMLMEKFNYRIVQQGFGFTDYSIQTRFADYRSDQVIGEIADKRIRNGTLTVDEVRSELGKTPYPKGGDVPVIVTSRELTPIPRLAALEEEQAQNAQIAIQTAQANAELAQAKAKQVNEPQSSEPTEPLTKALEPSVKVPQSTDDKQSDQEQKEEMEAFPLLMMIEERIQKIRQRSQTMMNVGGMKGIDE